MSSLLEPQTFETIEEAEVEPYDVPETYDASVWLQAWRAFKRDRLALVGLVVIVLVVAAAVLAPLISPADPTRGVGSERLLGPFTQGHLLGTDGQGRDILGRLIWGGRVSLAIGVIPVAIAFVISLFLGLVAGYFRSWIGQLIMRSLDILLAFPLVLLAIALVGVLGPGMLNVMLSLVLVELPYMTRVVFTETSVLRNRPFVVASRASGSRTPRILFHEILPNVLSTLIVYSAVNIGAFIVIGAGFSFLGIGITPPTPDWGIMTSDGRLVLAQAPHVAAVPGIAIVLVALAFNWVGDGLRDALDPRLRTR